MRYCTTHKAEEWYSVCDDDFSGLCEAVYETEVEGDETLPGDCVFVELGAGE